MLHVSDLRTVISVPFSPISSWKKEERATKSVSQPKVQQTTIGKETRKKREPYRILEVDLLSQTLHLRPQTGNFLLPRALLFLEVFGELEPDGPLAQSRVDLGWCGRGRGWGQGCRGVSR